MRRGEDGTRTPVGSRIDQCIEYERGDPHLAAVHQHVPAVSRHRHKQAKVPDRVDGALEDGAYRRRLVADGRLQVVAGDAAQHLTEPRGPPCITRFTVMPVVGAEHTPTYAHIADGLHGAVTGSRT